jgi:hypothetical protein
MLRSVLAALLVTSLVACDTSPRGPLADLASEWTGGAAVVRCLTTGPHGEYLGPVPGTELCEWINADTIAPPLVTGMRFQRRLASITWSPSGRDSASAAQNVALVQKAMRERGLVARPCTNAALTAMGVQGTRWESATLAVQLSHARMPTGEERVVVLAYDAPGAIATQLCSAS